MLLDPCIRRLRQLKGWSVYRLAKEAGISRSYLAVIEQGGGNCSLETFGKLLAALGVQEAVLVPSGDDLRIVLKKESGLVGSPDPPLLSSGRTAKRRQTSGRAKKR